MCTGLGVLWECGVYDKLKCLQGGLGVLGKCQLHAEGQMKQEQGDIVERDARPTIPPNTLSILNMGGS